MAHQHDDTSADLLPNHTHGFTNATPDGGADHRVADLIANHLQSTGIGSSRASRQ